MYRMTTLFMSTLLFLAFTATGTMAEAKNLRMSMLAPETNVETQLVRKIFIPYIEEKSGGRYKINFYPGSTLGNTETVVQGVVMGTIDIALDTAGNFDQFCPSLALLDLPYLFKREDVAKLNASPVGQQLREAGKKTGLYIIDLNCWFPRNLISRIPLRTFQELQGVKNRTTGSKWQMMGIAAMGMKPVPTPAAEMLTAIQQGMVDSMDINLPAMIGYRVVDVAKHITITNQAQMMGAFVCSQEFWADLSDEDKKLFTQAAQAWSKALDDAVANQSNELIEQSEKAGCKIHFLSDEDTAKLKAQTEANFAKTLSKEENELLNKIRAAVK